jgi:hypothetical protein
MELTTAVVRAGLTPKYKDIQTLCSMLTYKQVSSVDDITIMSRLYYFLYILLVPHVCIWQVYRSSVFTMLPVIFSDL